MSVPAEYAHLSAGATLWRWEWPAATFEVMRGPVEWHGHWSIEGILRTSQGGHATTFRCADVVSEGWEPVERCEVCGEQIAGGDEVGEFALDDGRHVFAHGDCGIAMGLHVA